MCNIFVLIFAFIAVHVTLAYLSPGDLEGPVLSSQWVAPDSTLPVNPDLTNIAFNDFLPITSPDTSNTPDLPQQPQINPVSTDTDLWAQNSIAPILTANTGTSGSAARPCQSENTPTNGKLDAREAGAVCDTKPPTEVDSEPIPGGQNEPATGVGDFFRKIFSLPPETEVNPEVIPKPAVLSPKVEQESKCKAPYPYHVCCKGPYSVYPRMNFLSRCKFLSAEPDCWEIILHRWRY